MKNAIANIAAFEKFQTLVNGTTHTFNGVVGTDRKIREAVWNEFTENFKDGVAVEVLGVKVELFAKTSKSGKTTSYYANLTPEQFTTITGIEFIGTRSKNAYISVNFGRIEIFNGDDSHTTILNADIKLS